MTMLSHSHKRKYGQTTYIIDSETPPMDKKKRQKMAVANVCLPTETWLQVIAWIRRMELGTATSFVSRRFWRIVHVRLHEKCALFPEKNTRKMRWFVIIGESDARDLPKCPPPDNIVGIRWIELYFLDSNVLAFFKRIQPLLSGKELRIEIGSHKFHNYQASIIALEHLLPLCTDGTISCGVGSHDDLGDMAKISKLVQWLMKPKEGGKPKLLKLKCFFNGGKQFVEQLKTNFYLATVPSSFIIQVHHHDYDTCWEYETFAVQNQHTGELLTMTKPRSDSNFMLITRCTQQTNQQSIGAVEKQMSLNWDWPINLDGAGMGRLSLALRKIGNLDGNGEENYERRRQCLKLNLNLLGGRLFAFLS